MKKLLLVGSNSIHCKRYIAGVLKTQLFDVEIITNQYMDEFANNKQVLVNFALHNLKAARHIRKLITEFKPDVIHIHQANSYAWHTFRALKKITPKPKVILTTWGSDVLILPHSSKLMKKMVVANLVNADLITSDSLFMSAQISKLIQPIQRNIKTINFGIQELPVKQDLHNKKKYILSNRLHKSLYRIDKIISAFANLVVANKISPEYILVVAAAGDLTPKLMEMVTKLGIENRVIFTGMIPYSELVNYYQQASVFVSVPESDGTASSLLEAMAYGCVPVLSNLPANLEWVIDGVNGFITADIADLVDSLLLAVKIVEDSEQYQQLYDLNYQIIARKAVFASNIRKFIELY